LSIELPIVRTTQQAGGPGETPGATIDGHLGILADDHEDWRDRVHEVLKDLDIWRRYSVLTIVETRHVPGVNASNPWRLGSS
jgi:hypothetical protein